MLANALLAYRLGQNWDIPYSDFHFMWVAGDMWNAGLSPYTDEFSRRIAEFEAIRISEAWYYPPSWFPIATLIAQTDASTATRLWRVITIILLLAASALNVASFRFLAGNSAILAPSSPIRSMLLSLPFLTLFMLHFGLVGLSQSAEKNIQLAQSSALIYFGVSLLVYSLSRAKLMTGAIGLALIILKPQLGVAMTLVLLFSALGRKIVFFAALISIAMATPAFLIASPFEVTADLLHNLSVYGDQIFNTAIVSTGLRNAVWTLGGSDAGMTFYQLAALCFILIAALALYIQFRAPPQPLDLVMLAIVFTLFIASLHYYSFVSFGALVLYCLSLRTASALICGGAFLMIARAGNLPNPPTMHGHDVMAFGGNLYMTIAAGMILFVLMWNFSRRPTPVTATPENSRPSRFSSPGNSQHTEF